MRRPVYHALIALLLWGWTVAAADAAARGYVDRDRDGRNDLFRDADGNGVDDVSGEPYPHKFLFADEDGDGKNDLFRDADGDGVNDLNGKYVDADGDGICENVIDEEGDGVNDITGAKYDEKELGGGRYGRIDEGRGRVYRRFVDEDGDGMQDLHRRVPVERRPEIDYFVDEDGDGIYDGRSIRGRGVSEGIGDENGRGAAQRQRRGGRR